MRSLRLRFVEVTRGSRSTDFIDSILFAKVELLYDPLRGLKTACGSLTQNRMLLRAELILPEVSQVWKLAKIPISF